MSIERNPTRPNELVKVYLWLDLEPTEHIATKIEIRDGFLLVWTEEKLYGYAATEIKKFESEALD